MNCKKCREQLDLLKAYTSWLKQAASRGNESRKFEEAYEVMEEIKEKIANLEQILWVSYERAQEILGEENVVGPEAIEAILSFKLKEIPRIPFSEQMLERAKNLNMMLVLRPDKLPNGQSLTLSRLADLLRNKQAEWRQIFKDQASYIEVEPLLANSSAQNIAIRPGWALVSKTSVAGQEMNYHNQTPLIIRYFKKLVDKQEIPVALKEAIESIESEELEKMGDQLIAIFELDDDQTGTEKDNNRINRNTIRNYLIPNPAEVIFDIISCFYNPNRHLKTVNLSTLPTFIHDKTSNIWTNFINDRRDSAMKLYWIGGRSKEWSLDGQFFDTNTSAGIAILAYRGLVE